MIPVVRNLMRPCIRLRSIENLDKIAINANRNVGTNAHTEIDPSAFIIIEDVW